MAVVKETVWFVVDAVADGMGMAVALVVLDVDDDGWLIADGAGVHTQYGTSNRRMPPRNFGRFFTRRHATALVQSVPTYNELPDSEMKRLADRLLAIADELKAEITFGTREQWTAWELLDNAARYVYNACFYLDVHEAKTADRV